MLPCLRFGPATRLVCSVANADPPVGMEAKSVTASPAIAPVVFGAPLPLDSDPALAGELAGVLDQIANGSTITENASLIQGGVGIIEGRTANRLLNNARQNGDLPAAQADVRRAGAPDAGKKTRKK